VSLYEIKSSVTKELVTVRKSRFVRFLVFADLAGVEGLRVPLMLGDAPSLLEHLESNQLGERSLTVRPRVTACYRDRFVRVPFPSRSLTIPFAYRYSHFLFSLSVFLSLRRISSFVFHGWRDGSYIPSGLSGREPWPCSRKISFFPIFFSLHGLEFIGIWASCLNVPFPFSSLDSNPINSLRFPDPCLFFLTTVSLLRVENS
jgi:hypothetical protein